MAKHPKEQTIAERISATPVSAAAMLELNNEVNELPPDLRDFEGLMFTAARIFADKPDMAVAVVFRMEALARLIKAGRLPGWTRPKEPDGSIATHEALFAAAGELPLQEKANRLVFNRKEFLTRAFQLAKKK